MTEEITLLKHGFPKVYRICDCCQRYAGSMSARNWCRYCEWECTAIGKRLREKLALMSSVPTPIGPEGNTAPQNAQSAPGDEESSAEGQSWGHGQQVSCA